jgi:hypothetical protein
MSGNRTMPANNQSVDAFIGAFMNAGATETQDTLKPFWMDAMRIGNRKRGTGEFRAGACAPTTRIGMDQHPGADADLVDHAAAGRDRDSRCDQHHDRAAGHSERDQPGLFRKAVCDHAADRQPDRRRQPTGRPHNAGRDQQHDTRRLHCVDRRPGRQLDDTKIARLVHRCNNCPWLPHRKFT